MACRPGSGRSGCESRRSPSTAPRWVDCLDSALEHRNRGVVSAEHPPHRCGHAGPPSDTRHCEHHNRLASGDQRNRSYVPCISCNGLPRVLVANYREDPLPCVVSSVVSESLLSNSLLHAHVVGRAGFMPHVALFADVAAAVGGCACVLFAHPLARCRFDANVVARRRLRPDEALLP